MTNNDIHIYTDFFFSNGYFQLMTKLRSMITTPKKCVYSTHLNPNAITTHTNNNYLIILYHYLFKKI